MYASKEGQVLLAAIHIQLPLPMLSGAWLLQSTADFGTDKRYERGKLQRVQVQVLCHMRNDRHARRYRGRPKDWGNEAIRLEFLS